jgi:hypothetical protein
MHFPLLRASAWFPTSTQYIFTSQLEPQWKENKTITLKPGETYTISLPEGLHETRYDPFGVKNPDQNGRWALVFGVPDGEDPDKYLVGTVLSNPIQWRNEIKDKESK